MSQSKNDSGLIIGIVLISAGVLFLLDSFYIWNLRYVIQHYWPLTLIAIGIILMVKAQTIRHSGGITLLIIGLVFQARELHLFRWHDIGRVWPAALIAIGVWIIIKNQRDKSLQMENGEKSTEKN